MEGDEETGTAGAELTGTTSKSSGARSEEHTSELQSPCNLVCRLLLEKKKYPAMCLPLTDCRKKRPAPSSPRRNLHAGCESHGNHGSQLVPATASGGCSPCTSEPPTH